jgi:E3 ubiquitin-protein ligase SIAH1
MDDSSRGFNETVLNEIECPVCMQYMVPPIKICTNGHNICSKCRGRVTSCPTCRAEFSEIRNVALENIARRLKYPCANRQSGCLELLSMEHIAKHHAVCVYGEIKCPLHLAEQCSWKGLKDDLKEHAKAKHSNAVITVSTFHCPKLSGAVGFVSYFGELFTYCKQKRHGRHYVAVQLIGTNSEASKYKCEFTLHAANGVEQISNTFLVQGYSESFETIFNSGKCLNLDASTVKLFVVENKLNLTVTLSTV